MIRSSYAERFRPKAWSHDIEPIGLPRRQTLIEAERLRSNDKRHDGALESFPLQEHRPGLQEALQPL